MEPGKAYAIFKGINTDKWSNELKLESIDFIVNRAATINCITKNDLKNALTWILDLYCEGKDDE